MIISDFSFGRIVVNGKTYSKDVIIFPDQIFSPWRRGEGHLLQIDDLVEVVKTDITEVIIGTGYYGSMKVPSDVIEFLKDKGITTSINKTPDAADVFNRTISERAAIAALHLTC